MTWIWHAIHPPRPPSIKIISDIEKLIWGVIKGHIAANKMLEKSIKDHPIVVGDYAQWILSNYRRKEATDANIMATKLKYKVDGFSSLTTSAAKIIK